MYVEILYLLNTKKQFILSKSKRGSHQRASITNVNICCAAGAVSGCICWYFVSITSNAINIDEYIKIENKNVIFVCTRVYLSMSQYVALFQIFTIYCSTMCIVNIIIMYHNVLITTHLSNTTSTVKFSEIKEFISAFCLLVLLNALYKLLISKKKNQI